MTILWQLTLPRYSWWISPLILCLQWFSNNMKKIYYKVCSCRCLDLNFHWGTIEPFHIYPISRSNFLMALNVLSQLFFAKNKEHCILACSVTTQKFHFTGKMLCLEKLHINKKYLQLITDTISKVLQTLKNHPFLAYNQCLKEKRYCKFEIIPIPTERPVQIWRSILKYFELTSFGNQTFDPQWGIILS
jgi:hypothetical protein